MQLHWCLSLAACVAVIWKVTTAILIVLIRLKGWAGLLGQLTRQEVFGSFEVSCSDACLLLRADAYPSALQLTRGLPQRSSLSIAKPSIVRTWRSSKRRKNYYRYKHKIWYVQRGWGGTHRYVAEISNFKFSNDFFVRSRKNSSKTFINIWKRYGKIRSLKCGENLSSDHTMTIPKWVWGLILPLVRSNDR